MIAKTTAIAALAALGFAASAQGGSLADTADSPPSVTVQTAGLNLDTEAGARIALNRLRAAARQVCGAKPSVRDFQARASYQACVRDAVDATVASSGSPMLAKLNGTPQSPATLAAVAP